MLHIIIAGDAMVYSQYYDGTYIYNGNVNGRMSWLKSGGGAAIWYYPEYKDWAIGNENKIGTNWRRFTSASNLETICPYNADNVWKYWDDTAWLATNDVYIICDFCTSENSCGIDQADCETHDECQEGLMCGSNNCPTSLGYPSEVDCCYQPMVGNCTGANPCEEHEGDCNSDDECQNGLSCGSNNCPESLGFESDINCCYVPESCGVLEWKGDDYCDDENNNEGCEWDGGDCCGSDINIDYCIECECLDPDEVISKKKGKFSRSENIRQELKKPNNLKYSRLNNIKLHKSQQYPKIEEMLLNTSQRKLLRSHTHKKTLKTSTNSEDQIHLRNSFLASSKYGLIVILNPNEAEYTDAVKNNYVGFKTLVHTPYNFAEVDAVGMAMDKNIQATVGIRGHHAWITDAANALGLYQKKCLSRVDDMKKYKEVKLEVFANYTRKGCILECHANIFFNKCGCLPYHYPDFSTVWKKSTACNHTALQCMSKLVGKYDHTWYYLGKCKMQISILIHSINYSLQ